MEIINSNPNYPIQSQNRFKGKDNNNNNNRQELKEKKNGNHQFKP